MQGVLKLFTLNLVLTHSLDFFIVTKRISDWHPFCKWSFLLRTMQLTLSMTIMQVTLHLCGFWGGTFWCWCLGGSFRYNYAVRNFCGTYAGDSFYSKYVRGNSYCNYADGSLCYNYAGDIFVVHYAHDYFYCNYAGYSFILAM